MTLSRYSKYNFVPCERMGTNLSFDLFRIQTFAIPPFCIRSFQIRPYHIQRFCIRHTSFLIRPTKHGTLDLWDPSGQRCFQFFVSLYFFSIKVLFYLTLFACDIILQVLICIVNPNKLSYLLANIYPFFHYCLEIEK